MPSIPDLSPFQGVFRAAPPPRPANTNTGNGSGSGSTRTKIKRNRLPVSCTACRARKLKCDRQHPCASCAQRDEAATCNFSTEVNTAAAAGVNGQRGAGAASRSKAQASLARLEDMVNVLLQARGSGSYGGPAQLVGRSDGGAVARTSSIDSSTASSNSKSPDLDDNVRSLSIANTPQSSVGESSTESATGEYTGATNWAGVFDQIRRLQGYLETEAEDEEHEPVPAPKAPTKEVDVLLKISQPVTIADILDALPPRPLMDRMMFIFFKTRYMSASFLHTAKFKREYERFWQEPSSASWLWISIVLSALYIAMMVTSTTENATMAELKDVDVDKLITRAGQCLIAGDYTRPQPFAVEAIFLFGYCKYWQARDLTVEVWSIYSLMVRIAQKMGYHRDPKSLPFSPLTPFEVEMRRRTWFFVEVFDVAFSFQLGVPPILHEDQCDVEPPSNILDEDFDEDCTQLPPPRPMDKTSPMLVHHFKALTLRTFRKVVRHVYAIKRPSYDEVCRLDDELNTTHDSLPYCIRVIPLNQYSFTEESYAIMQRGMLELLYLKGLCVLHRPYLSYDKHNPRYERSRVTCRSAAMRVMDLQREYFYGSLPGGRIHEERWLFATLNLHDFLLSAMIICLDLMESTNLPPDERSQKIEALKICYAMCKDRAVHSGSAAHAAKVLAAILSKVFRQDTSHPIPSATTATTTTTTTTTTTPATAAREASHLPTPSSTSFAGAAPLSEMETHQIPSDISVLGQPIDFLGMGYEAMDTGGLDDVLGDYDNLDWNLIDGYIYNRKLEGSGMDALYDGGAQAQGQELDPHFLGGWTDPRLSS